MSTTWKSRATALIAKLLDYALTAVGVFSVAVGLPFILFAWCLGKSSSPFVPMANDDYWAKRGLPQKTSRPSTPSHGATDDYEVVTGLLMIALLFAGLIMLAWLVIAVIKFMWMHS